MRLAFFLLLFLVSNSLYGQEKIYVTYTTQTGMGIQLTYDNLPFNEIHTPITSSQYDFIDAFWLSADNRKIAKTYLRFKKEGKMGIMNAKGKEIIPAIYDTIQLCVRWPEEGVPDFKDFYLFEKNDQIWAQRCSNLKRLFPESYDSIHHDFYTGDLYCYKKNRAVYYCNTGKQLFPHIEFESIHRVISESNLDEYQPPTKIIAKEPGKPMSVYPETELFTNKEDAYLHEFLYIYEDEQDKHLVLASKSGKMGLLDELGNTRIPFLYDGLKPKCTYANNVGLKRLLITLNGKEGLCDYDGNLIFPPIYEAGSFSENECYYNRSMFIVEKDSSTNQGVVDALGTEIIPVQAQTIKMHVHNGYYTEHYFYVTRNGLKGVYSFDGLEIVPCAYYEIYDANAVKNSAKSPDFKLFPTKQE